jgi:hypothetical protein
MPKKDKRPRQSISIPQRGKVPRGASVDQSASQPFNWNLDNIDMDGPFGWKRSSIFELLETVFPKLKHFESMTWGEMPKTGSHAIEVGSLCKEARDRLEELNLAEYDTLYSVRLQGEPRLFGIKDRAVLRLLWWDPNHEVCPSNLKRT